MSSLGGFGALCEVPASYREPVLVSSTDGVGTKLKLAIDWGIHDSIGIDLVAMCVNDLVVTGAEPLLFLDYYATGTLRIDVAASVVDGIGRGCELAGCALVGGETAEMPGMYNCNDYDLAGFCVGIVEKSEIIKSTGVHSGDTLIALPSSGAHSNGYSLIRKILKEREIDVRESRIGSQTLAQALLEPTRIYVKPILQLLKNADVSAMAHITGGGLLENLPRVLPESVRAVIDPGVLDMPELFRWLKDQAHIDDVEMLRTFNCGVGMVLVVPKPEAETALDFLRASGEDAYAIGEVAAREPGESQIEIVGIG